jgi:hypothetical protein
MDRALADVGFQVMRLENATNLITVLGHAAMISAGEFVQASGIWVNDRTHGVQPGSAQSAPSALLAAGPSRR